MGTIRDLFVQTETFVLFLACVKSKIGSLCHYPLNVGFHRRIRSFTMRQRFTLLLTWFCQVVDHPSQPVT